MDFTRVVLPLPGGPIQKDAAFVRNAVIPEKLAISFEKFINRTEDVLFNGIRQHDICPVDPFFWMQKEAAPKGHFHDLLGQPRIELRLWI